MEYKITMPELRKAIKKLKKKKSPGPDNITNEMIQHLGNTALQKLLDIFNLSWNSGQVPQCWKEAIMIPVLKKGKNKSKAISYRPISLTSCLCKTMERIVNLRLQLYLETESILVPEQAGFRQYKSTEDQTTHLTQVIEDAFQAKKVTLAVFIDLQKAFDKVWKDGLLVKLLRSGIVPVDGTLPSQPTSKSDGGRPLWPESAPATRSTSGRSTLTNLVRALHQRHCVRASQRNTRSAVRRRSGALVHRGVR